MTIEVNMVGKRCGAKNGGLSCTYCYLPIEARLDDPIPPVDHEAVQKMVLAAAKGDPHPSFNLFGGEPLLSSTDDLKKIWKFGLEKFGKNGVQTSGRPITGEHLRLFKKYRVNVGFSIDGPGDLNAPRTAGSAEDTRKATAHSIAMLKKMIKRQPPPPGLIVTLHRKNATTNLPRLIKWLKELDALGLNECILHILERDGPTKFLALTDDENYQAFLAIHDAALDFKNTKFTVFRDMWALLRGKDSWKWNDGSDGGVQCVWTSCDPLTTPAVHGIGADGRRYLCQRVHKDGVSWLPAKPGPMVRQLVLRETPQEAGGCKGCKYQIMCKGQCPGTAIDGDWRKRTIDCQVWYRLFDEFSRRMRLTGEKPITDHPKYPAVEEAMVAGWQRGWNIRIRQAAEQVQGGKSRRKGGGDYTDHGDHDDMTGHLEQVKE